MASENLNPILEESDFYRELGRRIAAKRRGQNKTQEQLAEAVGLSRTSLTNIEKGGQRILAHTVYEIAFELGTDLSDLLPSAPVARPIERMEPAQRDLLLRAMPELALGDGS